jgi:hypothetical protein
VTKIFTTHLIERLVESSQDFLRLETWVVEEAAPYSGAWKGLERETGYDSEVVGAAFESFP